MGDTGLEKVLYIETKEHINKMMGYMRSLDIRRDADNSELLEELFRLLHTTKSAALSMSRQSMAELVHRMEGVVQALREGNLSLDRKIIKLLLQSCEHLEDILAVAEKNDNLELLFTTGVYKELCQVTSESEETKEQGNQQRDNLLRLEHSAKELMLESAQAYIIHIRISDDCAYQGIRVWMCFLDIAASAQIIASNPAMPTPEEFAAGSCDLGFGFMDLFVTSLMAADALQQHLTGLFVEVDAVYVGKARALNGVLYANYLEGPDDTGAYRFDHEKMEAACKDQMNGIWQQTAIVEKTVVYSKEFVHEIGNDVEKSMRLVSEVATQGADELLTELSNNLHHAKGISMFIEHDSIFELSREATRLVEVIKRSRIGMDDFDRNALITAFQLILMLCEQAESGEEKDVTLQIVQHCEMLRECSDKNESRAKELAVAEQETGIREKHVEAIVTDEEPVVHRPFGTLERYSNAGNVLTDREDRESELLEFKRSSFIKVPAIKVDRMIKVIGEMMLLHSKYGTRAENGLGYSEQDWEAFSHQLEELSELARQAGTLRVVELEQTLQMVQQVGRNAARELGKNIDIVINGGEIVVDSGIAERIHNSLMHLVKNAVDHGIEESEARRREIGKNPCGCITLTAWNEEKQTIIEVADDGRGINLQRVLEKAVERGFIKEEEVLTEDQILRLIFIPGFSTQEEVNRISGRGVGMSVVEEEIKKFGGRLEIITKIGVGTSFRIKIPVNHLAIDGIMNVE